MEYRNPDLARAAAGGRTFVPADMDKPIKRRSVVGLLLLLVPLLLIVGAAGMFGWNRYEARAYAQDLSWSQDFVGRFTGKVQLALSTPRIALAGPVGSLQELALDAKNHKFALACVNEAKSSLLAFTGQTIDGFLSFMQQQGEDTSPSVLQSALKQERIFTSAVLRCDPAAS